MKINPVRTFLCLLAAVWISTLTTQGYAAGEGTIPLMVTGRVIGNDDVRVVSNAPGVVSVAQQLAPEALTCLRGKKAQKFLARGELNLSGRMQDVLALCVEEGGELVEFYTIDRSSAAFLRIVGKVRIDR